MQTEVSFEALEARARRAAKTAGLKAVKRRWRTGTVDNLGGFMLLNPVTNGVVLGERFQMSAQDVIDFCRPT